MATTMHFGPEWMRAKQQPAVRSTAAPSPPPQTTNGPPNSNGPPVASSYSSLVTPQTVTQDIAHDVAHPFKYSKEDMLRIWKEGGGGQELPIDVERWEGVVREIGGDPACSKEMSEAEKRLFASPLNSEMRRRQSSDFNSPQGDRHRSYHSGPGGGLNLGLIGRRRRGDSNSTEQPSLTIPRKQSWSTGQGNLSSPVTSSPRTRFGGGSGTGFDGVLNGSDAWVSGRRRASGQVASARLDDVETDKATGMKVAEDTDIKQQDRTQTHTDAPGPDSTSRPQPPPEVKNIQESIQNLSLGPPVNESDTDHTPSKTDSAMQPERLDHTTAQWTYRDPEGNIQGPFPSDTMQNWHDQHYFPDDLPMKRVDIDSTWMTLVDVKLRATGDRIFLCPLRDLVPPPGLPRHPVDTQLYGRTRQFLQDQGPSVSASPVSSLGCGFGRPNGSPDPAVLGNKFVNQPYPSDPSIVNNIHGYPLSNSPALSMSSSRPGFHDSTQEPHLPVHHDFSAVTPNRTSSFDTSSVNSGLMQSAPWQAHHNNQAWNGVGHVSVEYNDHFNPIGAMDAMRVPTDPMPLYMTNGLQHRENGGMHPMGVQIQQDVFVDQNAPAPGGIHYGQIPVMNSFSGDSGISADPHLHKATSDHVHMDTEQRGTPPIAVPLVSSYSQSMGNAATRSDFAQPITPIKQSPWGVPSGPLPRPSPLDADIPSPRNLPVVKQPSPPPARAVTWQESHNNVQAWLTDSQRASGNEWAQIPEDPKSTIESDVHTDDLAPELSVSSDAPAGEIPTTQEDLVDEVDLKVSSKRKSSPAQDAPVVSPSKRKGLDSPVSGVDLTEDSKSAVSPAAAAPLVSSKAPWATEGAAEARLVAPPVSLREIQELELKKQGAKKVTEKEKERATKPSAVPETSFTASWGLPTSQAGARTSAVSIPKEQQQPISTSPANSSPATPVWTNAVKPAAKKSMKEIQEEEQRKKVQGKEKESVVTAKRAYGDHAAKPAPASSGGVWSTVGANGKVSAAAARPTIAASISQNNVTPVPNKTASVLSSTPRSSQAIKTVASVVGKQEEEPAPPSLEFLKWLKDSLRGLNSSVQFEEIAQMLLSFPLDPDPSTIELIAETVYGASTTLDGRRFASEFVAKRKADSAARPKATGVKPTTTSLAEVVKAQPKQHQSEWAYKVVKKKGRGAGKS